MIVSSKMIASKNEANKVIPFPYMPAEFISFGNIQVTQQVQSWP